MASGVPPPLPHAGVVWRIRTWGLEEGPWWLCSFVFHLVLVCSLALLGGKVVEKIVDEAPSFEEANVQRPIDVPQQIERFEVAETPEDPTRIEYGYVVAGEAGPDRAGGKVLRR